MPRSIRIRTIEELEQTFDRWDDGYEDFSLLFRHFTKGLTNLTSFVRVTLDAYSALKRREISNILEKNKELQRRSKGVTLGTVLPGIIDDYFVPRLFALSYLGSWGLLENYLRDILRSTLASNIIPGQARDAIALGVLKTSVDTGKLVDCLVNSQRNIHSLVALYKTLLGIDLGKNDDYKALISGRDQRNVLAHTGRIMGYESFLNRYLEAKEQQTSEEIQKKFTSNSKHERTKTIVIDPIISADEETVKRNQELESEFCTNLIHMWRLGDFLRHELLRFRETRDQ